MTSARLPTRSVLDIYIFFLLHLLLLLHFLILLIFIVLLFRPSISHNLLILPSLIPIAYSLVLIRMVHVGVVSSIMNVGTSHYVHIMQISSFLHESSLEKLRSSHHNKFHNTVSRALTMPFALSYNSVAFDCNPTSPIISGR